ncbi:MAG: S1C family serine protease [Actinomycetota bacterium]|nr:S1C family serine protease [Actinomycetota bacterium]
MRQSLRARMQPVLLGGALRIRRLRWRALTLAVAALVAIGVVTGAALARTSAPIGTGVVIIKTTLAYQGASAAGSGMVLTSSGEILTNNHVIRGATTITVRIPGTSRMYTAKVVGYDVTDDVAVLQAIGASNLKTVTTASSSKPAVGDAVTAVGNAGGTGTLTSARGAITGLTRSIVVSDDQGGTARLTGLIGADVGVQPGDSGGPLLNSAGKVIGMDTAGSTGYVSRSTTATQAYAIPIAKALLIAKQIESGQAATRVHIGKTPFLGIQVASDVRGGNVSSAGAVVAGVMSGSPAASAGLSAGDVITAIDGHAISSSSSLTSVILTKTAGAKVTISHTDHLGASHSTTVTLASGPAQ